MWSLVSNCSANLRKNKKCLYKTRGVSVAVGPDSEGWGRMCLKWLYFQAHLEKKVLL